LDSLRKEHIPWKVGRYFEFPRGKAAGGGKRGREKG